MIFMIFIPFLFALWSGVILGLSIFSKISKKNAKKILSWKTIFLLIIFVFAIDWSYQVYSTEGLFNDVISLDYFFGIIGVLSFLTIGTIFIIFKQIKHR